jgi:hypothetical protein
MKKNDNKISRSENHMIFSPKREYNVEINFRSMGSSNGEIDLIS